MLVDIPKDITAQTCAYEKQPPLPLAECGLPPQERLAQALELLNRAERPFVYCGGGVVLSEAWEALSAFVEKLDAPVSCSLMCQGGFDQASPRYMGTVSYTHLDVYKRQCPPCGKQNIRERCSTFPPLKC